jgi:phage-related protein
MPGKGRVALKFMPEEAKQKAREIAEKMVDQPPFKELYERYMKSVEEITRLHTIHPDAIKKAKDNAHNDLRDRLANVLLRGASSMQDAIVRGSLNQGRRSEKPSLHQEQQVARSVWRSVWRELDKERMRQEAQSEIEKRRELQRKARAKQRENEQDRER